MIQINYKLEKELRQKYLHYLNISNRFLLVVKIALTTCFALLIATNWFNKDIVFIIITCLIMVAILFLCIYIEYIEKASKIHDEFRKVAQQNEIREKLFLKESLEIIE